MWEQTEGTIFHFNLPDIFIATKKAERVLSGKWNQDRCLFSYWSTRSLPVKGVLESEVLMEISKSKRKSVAQIALRWAYGLILVFRSFNKERVKQYLQIFDWE